MIITNRLTLSKYKIIPFALATLALSIVNASASESINRDDVKVITNNDTSLQLEVTSTYILGDSDSIDMAKNIALQSAKISAAEKSGTYFQVERKTNGVDLDETISSISASKMKLDIIHEKPFTTENDKVGYTVTIRTYVNKSSIKDDLNAIQLNSKLQNEVERLTTEREQLKKDFDLLYESVEKKESKKQRLNEQSKVINGLESNLSGFSSYSVNYGDKSKVLSLADEMIKDFNVIAKEVKNASFVDAIYKIDPGYKKDYFNVTISPEVYLDWKKIKSVTTLNTTHFTFYDGLSRANQRSRDANKPFLTNGTSRGYQGYKVCTKPFTKMTKENSAALNYVADYMKNNAVFAQYKIELLKSNKLPLLGSGHREGNIVCSWVYLERKSYEKYNDSIYATERVNFKINAVHKDIINRNSKASIIIK